MLWGYATGQAVNGNLGDKLGGRIMMAMGAVLSFAANWAMSFGDSFLFLLVVWGVNGYVQSMGFAPGSRLLSNWWGHERRGFVYGIYVGFSGFSSVLAYALPLLVLHWLNLDWRWIFRLPCVLMLVGAAAVWFFVAEKPEDKGLPAPRSNPEEGADKEAAPTETSLERYKAVFRNWRLYATGASLGFQNAARYGLLVWAPVHLLGPNWKAGGEVAPEWITLALPVGMALGAISNSWVSDVLFGSRRFVAIIVYMVIAALVALALSHAAPGGVPSLVLMFMCGFFVFGPASSFWALCPDLFGRRLSGTATGVLNCWSYACAGLGEPMIGRLMDVTGDTGLIFPLVAGLCAASAVFAAVIRR